MPAGPSGAGDMFLYVKGAKGGVIKGESTDSTHANEIEVLSWSWGMQGRSSMSGQATGRVAVQELKIVKHVDSASTALMGALRSNEVVVKAVLTLRKAGKTQLEYLKITIEQGRVTALTIEAGDKSGSPELFEHVSFSFNKITVDYVPQGADGQKQGATSFVDQWHDN